MAADIRELADRAWNGERPVDAYRDAGTLFRCAPDVATITGFGNVVAIRTANGLVLIDTSQPGHIGSILAALREWSDQPVHTVVYTHGHFDQAGGMRTIDAEAARRGDPRPRVIAHEKVPARFARYTETSGYNGVINRRQFRGRASDAGDRALWEDWRQPDTTYRDALSVSVGSLRLELHHGKGETDDHTWVHLPAEGIDCTGDFFTWVCPNAGNPQKVQRYPREWAESLRAIIATGAQVLLPAHGLPIFGAERIAEALGNSASLLEHLVRETIALMNEGATFDEVLATVQAPPELLAKPYLAPVYDEPEFIVRNIWRLYGGWYDGNPARLKPAAFDSLAREIGAATGGASQLAKRAKALAEEGELRTSCELAELAGRAAPEDPEVHAIRAEVYGVRANHETSLMARSIYREAAEASLAVVERGREARL